jgi:hypothetical protein
MLPPVIYRGCNSRGRFRPADRAIQECGRPQSYGELSLSGGGWRWDDAQSATESDIRGTWKTEAAALLCGPDPIQWTVDVS